MISIYDGKQSVEGFDALTIRLCGDQNSDLDWSAEIAEADIAIAHGKKIFWEINLGLFSTLKHSINSEMQLKTLGLALNHFVELVWHERSESSIGLCLYRGNADFSENFPWDADQEDNYTHWLEDFESSQGTESAKKLFCRDVCTEYLNLLLDYVPDEVPTYLLYDCSSIDSSFEAALLLDSERTNRFIRALKNSPVGHREGVWEETKAPLIDQKFFIGKGEPAVASNPAKYGLFLPTITEYFTQDLSSLKKGFSWLEERNLPYRIVTEERIITDWDGLDYLFVAPSAVTPMAFRKLRGFVAAGGTVVSMDSPLGLEYEESLESMI